MLTRKAILVLEGSLFLEKHIYQKCQEGVLLMIICPFSLSVHFFDCNGQDIIAVEFKDGL
jgi:hypothetical protein